jgi:hypothetical protein
MIPCLAMVRVGRRHRRGIRLWLPLFLLWPLLLPFAGVLAIAATVMARVTGVAAAGALGTAWQLASGCRGMRIEVDSSEFALQVRFI